MHHVVEQMAEAHGKDDAEGSYFSGRALCGQGCIGHIRRSIGK
jgi:hypothetical protein